MQGILREVLPYVGEALREVVRDTATELVRSKVTRPGISAIRVEPTITDRDNKGCPYCTVAKQLAAAFRYLKRATEKPDYRPLYAPLSRLLVAEATQTIDHLLPNPDHRVLRQILGALKEHLIAGHERIDFEAAADLAWNASSLALDLAERVNTGEPAE
ncbi:MAG: hypothetical protein C4542_09630 [Dehalococcoidia bacterium]|nr:MAG: hypothetical protein C4542_09630 [Dehalococcoidia bacterium]